MKRTVLISIEIGVPETECGETCVYRSCWGNPMSMHADCRLFDKQLNGNALEANVRCQQCIDHELIGVPHADNSIAD